MIAPERNLIISLVAQNENHALETGASALGYAFGQRGYVHRIINLFHPAGGRELLDLLAQGQVAFAYGYAGVGSQLALTTGMNVWTTSRTPFVCLWFDHPAYNYRQHIVDSPYVIHCYHVKDHLEVRLNYLPASTSQNTLLHLTDGSVEAARQMPVARRPHSILYAKTAFQPHIVAEDWRRHAPQLQEILWAVTEMAKKDRNLDLAHATAALFKNRNLSLDNLNLFMGVVQEVDNYIRAWRSDRLGRALMAHPAHIYGRGWDYLKDQPRRAEFMAPISALEYLNRNADYKIVANSNPLWRDGIHERTQTAICFGSIALTDRSEKSEEILGGLLNYVSFEWDDDLQDTISEALKRSQNDSFDYYEAARQRLNERVVAKHTDYLAQIEAAAAKVRENTGSV